MMESNGSNNLRTTIAELYRAFNEVPRPRTIPACPCCVTQDEINILLSKALPEICSQELDNYASSVFLTAGSDEDFHYFLPRILDLLSARFGSLTEREVVGRAIATFGWTKFGAREKEALIAYLDAVLTEAMEAPTPDGDLIDEWLCCVSHFLPHWDKYLERVRQRPRALVALFESHCPALANGRLGNGFWDDSPRKEEFHTWITRLVEKGEINAAYGL